MVSGCADVTTHEGAPGANGQQMLAAGGHHTVGVETSREDSRGRASLTRTVDLRQTDSW